MINFKCTTPSGLIKSVSFIGKLKDQDEIDFVKETISKPTKINTNFTPKKKKRKK